MTQQVELRDKLRAEVQKPPEIQVEENSDKSALPELQRQADIVKRKNDEIKAFIDMASKNPH